MTKYGEEHLHLGTVWDSLGTLAFVISDVALNLAVNFRDLRKKGEKGAHGEERDK